MLRLEAVQEGVICMRHGIIVVWRGAQMLA